jgi:hypothetical protein
MRALCWVAAGMENLEMRLKLTSPHTKAGDMYSALTLQALHGHY